MDVGTIGTRMTEYIESKEKKREEAISLLAESGAVGRFISQSDYEDIGDNVLLCSNFTKNDVRDLLTYSRRKIRVEDVLIAVNYDIEGEMETFKGFIFTPDVLYYVEDEEIQNEFDYNDIETVDIEKGQYSHILINDESIDCSCDGETYGKEMYNYILDLLEYLENDESSERVVGL